MSCRIAHAGHLSESFQVKTGVRQGCLLSPFLFLLVIDWIIKSTTAGRKNGIQWTLWTQLDDLDFVDDLALLSHSHSQMQDKTTCLKATSAGTGLKINRKKTELMKINTTANTPVTVGGEPIREVESFVYLGSVVDGQGGTDRDITARIGKARAAMVMLKNIWASKVISTRTKLRIFNFNVKSVLLYRCETWRITKTMQQKIQSFFNTCLRRIFNIRWPEKIQNEEQWERAGQEPLAKQILRRKCSWIGHTLRKPASSTTRQAMTWNPQGKRKRGRPCNSWSDSETEASGPGPQSQSQPQSQSHSIEIWPRFLIVHCTAEGKKAARLHPFLVGETLRSCTGRPDASRLRSGDLLVECKRKAHSNSLLQLQKIGDYPVTVSPHRSLNSSRGVIRDEALADLGEAELIRALKSQAVTHAKVFKTGTIILTFGQPTAPEKLWAGFYWVKVKAFIPLPLRCFKCQRFGHGQASCRNDPTCAKCGGKDHDDKDCSSSPACINCKGSHPSSSKDCPKWKEECTIQRIRVEQKVSFPEARRMASARTQKGDKGVEVTNPFNVLEDMEVVTIEDRPLPPSPLVSPSKTSAVT
nr:hypothetical protein BaRGS_006306 [Batillaria attramentaria]